MTYFQQLFSIKIKAMILIDAIFLYAYGNLDGMHNYMLILIYITIYMIFIYVHWSFLTIHLLISMYSNTRMTTFAKLKFIKY